MQSSSQIKANELSQIKKNSHLEVCTSNDPALLELEVPPSLELFCVPFREPVVPLFLSGECSPRPVCATRQTRENDMHVSRYPRIVAGMEVKHCNQKWVGEIGSQDCTKAVTPRDLHCAWQQGRAGFPSSPPHLPAPSLEQCTHR
jgi:hypothetical protein